jgi:hypothetical protein
LGDAVRVVTRRFDASEHSATVLSFDELSRRPLLRRAVTGELPIDYTTRVSVKLNESSRSQLKPNKEGTRRENYTVSFVSIIVHLIASVDVDIEIIDRINGETHKHAGQWLDSSGATFLEEVCSCLDQKSAEEIISTHNDRVQPIIESDGTVVGRGALLISKSRNAPACIVSVGGFSSQRNFVRYSLASHEEFNFVTNKFDALPIVGVVLGDTQDASRARALVTVSDQAIENWAKGQDNLISKDQFSATHQVEICHTLLKLGAVSTKFPFGFLGGEFVTVAQFTQAIGENAFVDVPMIHSDYKSGLEFRDVNSLTRSCGQTGFPNRLTHDSRLLFEEGSGASRIDERCGMGVLRAVPDREPDAGRAATAGPSAGARWRAVCDAHGLAVA